MLRSLPSGEDACRFKAFVKGMTDSDDLTIVCEATGKDARTLAKSVRNNEGIYILGDLSIRPYRNKSGQFLAPIIVKVRFFKFLGSIRPVATHIWLTAKGNLGDDPDARHTPKGLAVTNFNIAVNELRRGAKGDAKKFTHWLAVTTWRGKAETCAKYLTKGSKVEVRGSHVGVEIWKTKTGEDRATLTLTAQVVEFLNRAPGTVAEIEDDEDGPPWDD